METLLVQTGTHRAAVPSVTGKTLNAMDCAMLSVNEALRSLGFPGFETQVLLWLNGRVDVHRLRAALSALAAQYPVIASRLDETETGVPCWRFRPGAECPLRETDLDSADPAGVLDFAAGLLSHPGRAEDRDPVRFFLIHRADGRDVFLIQYDHAVMDNNAAVLLLRRIEELSGITGEVPAVPGIEKGDLVEEYLGGFSRWRRLRAVGNVLDLRYRRLRQKPACLNRHDGNGRSSVGFRFATRCLDGEETSAFQSRVGTVCGFPGESMAVLASVFRALAEGMPRKLTARRHLVAGLGVDLGMRRADGPIFQNLMSIVPIQARPEELHDWEALVRQLNGQLRDRLAGEIDLGVLQLAAFSRNRRGLVQWPLRRLLQRGYSLWHAHFGSADGVGEEFCGAPVEDVMYTASTWTSLGAMFLAHRFRGRLRLQITYLPSLMPPAKAEEFLDTVRRDLLGRRR